MTAIIKEALEWVGTPYRHGASIKGAGCDCLGLILGVWRNVLGPFTPDIPDYAPDWSINGPDLIDRLAVYMPRAEIVRAGQVVVFSMKNTVIGNHLGIQISEDDATFIHSYSGHGVTLSRLTQPWSRRIAARFDFVIKGET